jgi:hypothetical protein
MDESGANIAALDGHEMRPHNHNPYRSLVWLTVALLLALPGSGLAQTSPSTWPTVLSSSGFTVPVASGVLYSRFAVTTSEGPLDVHHLRMDLHNPTVRLGVGLARDRLMSEDEPVSSMVVRTGAIAGINGDYFDIRESGMPLNIHVRDGQLLRNPWRFVALAIRKDGAVRIVRFRWTGTIVLPETGETRPLDGYNSGIAQDGVIAISDVRGYGAPPPELGVRQTVVELTPAGDSGQFLVTPASVTPLPASNDTGRYFVKQIWPQQAYYSPLPKDAVILLGRGSGADWLARKLTAGAVLQVNLTTDPDWHEFQSVIGGGPVLVQNGQLVEDPDAPAPQERDRRNPVIAVGIGQDGRTLTVVEVDGRQPNLSIGLTRPELAAYMRWLGAYQAMAFDSGGSATVVARLPGQLAPTVVNSPSDGRERPVANALLVYSTSIPGPAVGLLVNANQPLRLFVGAKVPLSLIGLDAQGNPVPPPDPLQASASPPIVTVSGGAVRAGSTPGTGVLQVQSGPAEGSVRVFVTSQLRRLIVSPETVKLVPGAGWTFAMAGQDSDGRQVALPEAAGTWVVNPPWLGTISAPGEFVAGDRPGTGTLSVQLGGTSSRVRVAIANVARPINEFDRGDWSFRGLPSTVTGSVAQVMAPSHQHRPSAQLMFQLEGASNRAAYLVTRLGITGAPTAVTLWVHGDGSGVSLRGTYDQASGSPGSVIFARRVTWQGWRSVTAALPGGLAYPITWTSFYVIETDSTRSPHGVLYLSSPRAIYPQAAAR